MIDAYTHEETDDAYVTGHLHNLAPRIAGQVSKVLVDDNQLVKAGDTLVKLDPMEYQAIAAAAKANLGCRAVQPRPPATADRLARCRAGGCRQGEEHARCRPRPVRTGRVADPVLHAHRAGGWLRGPENVEVGNRVSAGQTLLVVVDPDVWVVGNFKETQLAHMKPHQPVKITIDSIPDKVFDGEVDSFSPATGNEFALLPADNSTGNFTKIVQRVPVKITFKKESIHGYEDRIRAGESAIVKVAL